MRALYVVHIVAGGLGLLTGYVTLYAAKGATLHRRSGTLFVVAMLAMTFVGGLIAATRGVAPAVNVPAAVVTAYLVITALITIRPLAARSRWLALGLMLVALAVGLTSLTFGFEALANGGTRDGMPAFPFFLFGVVGLVAGISDVRIVRSGPLQGTSRLARHLWRMSFALFIAAMSFFIGQADEIPQALRVPALLALPVVAVLVTMVYWLWRVRVRGSVPGIVVGHGAPAAVRGLKPALGTRRRPGSPYSALSASVGCTASPCRAGPSVASNPIATDVARAPAVVQE